MKFDMVVDTIPDSLFTFHHKFDSWIRVTTVGSYYVIDYRIRDLSNSSAFIASFAEDRSIETFANSA